MKKSMITILSLVALTATIPKVSAKQDILPGTITEKTAEEQKEAVAKAVLDEIKKANSEKEAIARSGAPQESEAEQSTRDNATGSKIKRAIRRVLNPGS